MWFWGIALRIVGSVILLFGAVLPVCNFVLYLPEISNLMSTASEWNDLLIEMVGIGVPTDQIFISAFMEFLLKIFAFLAFSIICFALASALGALQRLIDQNERAYHAIRIGGMPKRGLGGLAPDAPPPVSPTRGYAAPTGRPDTDRRHAAQVGREAQIHRAQSEWEDE